MPAYTGLYFTLFYVVGTALAVNGIIVLNAKNPSHHCNGFFNLHPGDVVVPTAVESHITNAALSPALYSR